jgi:bifunctional non-homologous end joining protein LigD
MDAPSPPLAAALRARAPDRSPEPSPSGRGGWRGRFLVQQHAFPRPHYDLRLEMDGGALESWTLPEGPSLGPEVRRRAVHGESDLAGREDLEGGDGPDGGAVIVWDEGGYHFPDPAAGRTQLERGRLELELQGHKLCGHWTLVRESGPGADWRLVRRAAGPAPEPDATDRYARSVRSGLTLEEIQDPDAVRTTVRARLRALQAPRAEVVAREQGLMLATLATRPPEGEDWLFEVKYDGVRVLAERRGDAVTLLGRSGRVVTGSYPEIVAALRALVFGEFVLDGEIVALDARGTPSFQRLQARIGLTRPADVTRAMATVPVQAVFFDCLALEGHDLRSLPLAARKACLGRVLPPLGVARPSDHVDGAGPAALEVAAAAGLEGIVAKQRASPYVPRRSDAWLKIKCQRQQEFVIGGYTDPQGARAGFGALHLGLYDGARLVYVSKVGTGFGGAELERLWRRLGPLRRDTTPFDVGTPSGRGHHWVEPRLVAEVRYTDWTRDRGIRHPTYLGLRDDIRPEDCRREDPAAEDDSGGLPSSIDRARPPAATSPAPLASTSPGQPGAPASWVRPTDLDTVLWPADGFTKGDLVAYYDAIAPALLPYLRDRPIIVTRYPDGITGRAVLRTGAPERAPSWIRIARVPLATGHDAACLVVDDAEALRYVANLGAIPVYAWSARVDSLGCPDWLVLDLEPQGAPFSAVARVGQAARPAAGRARAPELRQDLGRHRPPRPGAARRPLHARAGGHAGPRARDARRRRRAGDRHAGALPRRRGGRHRPRRRRAQRPRSYHRRAVLRLAGGRGPRLLPARMAGGDRAARPNALHDPYRPGADRPRGRPAPTGPRSRDRPGRRARAARGPRQALGSRTVKTAPPSGRVAPVTAPP